MKATDGRILAVKVPEDAHEFYVSTYSDLSILSYKSWIDSLLIGDTEKLPHDNWRVISLHSKGKPMSEEDTFSLLPEFNGWDFCVFKSLESWCRKHEVYIENPYGETRPFIYDSDAGTDRERLGYKWDEAEKRTGTWLFLLKQ